MLSCGMFIGCSLSREVGVEVSTCVALCQHWKIWTLENFGFGDWGCWVRPVPGSDNGLKTWPSTARAWGCQGSKEVNLLMGEGVDSEPCRESQGTLDFLLLVSFILSTENKLFS